MAIKVNIVKKQSKKTGKEFEAVQLTIGEYTSLIFPSKIELYYISNYLESQAHAEFQEGLDEELKK